MTQLAGFLDVLLRGFGTVGLSAAIGGLVYVLLVLRPTPGPGGLVAAARGRALSLISAGALLVAGTAAPLLLIVHPWALADETGRWPLTDFLTTEFGLAGLGRVALALLLVASIRWIRRAPTPGRWAVAVVLGVLLMVNAAWLAHAVSRLQDRGPLMVMTVLHQLGAVIWVGGLIHLVAFALLWRRAGGPTAEPLGVGVLARFSGVAIGALALVVAPGIWLSISYVGSWDGLIGTGYGVMVLTKVALLGCAVILGALNLLLLRRGGLLLRRGGLLLRRGGLLLRRGGLLLRRGGLLLRRGGLLLRRGGLLLRRGGLLLRRGGLLLRRGGLLLRRGRLILRGGGFLLRRGGGDRAGAAVAARVPAFIEAEVGVGITLLLAAGSLTSLPPAVDVVADRAAPAEVAARFRPAMPRLSSPPVSELLAVAAPMDDALAKRQPEE